MVSDRLVRVACPVCAGQRWTVICRAREIAAQHEYLRRFHKRRLRGGGEEELADRAEFTQDYATNIVGCDGCGLVFRNPRPPDGAIARAYEQDKYGFRRLASLSESQVELYRPKARALRRWLQPGARVVEVGSFVGGFLTAGEEAGWRMLGVDPGKEVDAFCKERGLQVFRGELQDLLRDGSDGWGAGTADCVAVWNAFDQLPDPETTAASARRLLRPGGLLVLRVANGECFRCSAGWMRRLPRLLSGWLRAALAWNNLLTFPYLYGYTAPTLDWLLGRHGFRREAVRPDTLCRLADERTRTWAAAEEWILKRLIRAAARLEQAAGSESLCGAPWLDLYFRASGPPAP